MIAQPKLYEALAADQALGDQQTAGVGEVVTYEWGGHRPVAADSPRVTVPSLAWTLRSHLARTRMTLATSDGVCFAQWRVTARPLDGYDGAQDPGAGWYLLGQGSAQTDATVVQGVPQGEWILHVHLGYAAADSALPYTSESYVRVIVGDQPALPLSRLPLLLHVGEEHEGNALLLSGQILGALDVIHFGADQWGEVSVSEMLEHGDPGG